MLKVYGVEINSITTRMLHLILPYYPYTENLTMQNIVSEEDIVSYFTSKLSLAKGSKEAYYACDVLTAPVDATTLSDGGKWRSILLTSYL